MAAVEVPSLREKKEDIPDLVNHFITGANRKLRKTIIGISQEALELLGAYNWPGNVRELEAELIKKVGAKLENNKSAIARALGISRVTLQKKMSQTGEQ